MININKLGSTTVAEGVECGNYFRDLSDLQILASQR